MSANGTAAGGIRVVVDGAGHRVLVFGMQRIPLPGLHGGGAVPEARVAEDQNGRRVLLLGAEEIPLPAGDAPPEAAAPDLSLLGGHLARVEADATGRTYVSFDGRRVEIAPLSLTAQEAAAARVLVDDSGRHILVAGPNRVVIAAPPAASAPPVVETRSEPAIVLKDDAGQTVLLHAGERTPLPGVVLTPAEARSARVETDARGRRHLVAGAHRIDLSSPHDSAEPEAPAPVPVASARPLPARSEPADSDAEPDLNLRSEELQEIIGFIPHWLVRWGTTLVFATVAMLFAVGWLVRYPDVVSGKVVLTTPEPPVRLVPRVSGEVAHLFVRDGERVKPGAPLLVLRSSARWEDVFALSRRLEQVEGELGGDLGRIAASFDPMLSLGDLHPAYAAFLQSLSDRGASSAAGYDARRVAEVEQQIRDQQVVRANAAAKQRVQADQLDLARRDRDRARAMASRGLISEADAERAEAEYLQRRSAMQDGESAVAAADVQISASRSQLLELGRSMEDMGRNQGLALRAALATLRGAVARWDQENVMRAPSAGRVSNFRALAEHQFVEQGAPLLAIVPEGGRAVGRVLLASAGAGKVEVGQRVLLRLESFPSREFGAVAGRVARVSQLAMEKRDSDETQYLVEVEVPQDLVTTYRRRLPFRQEMRGDAEIVTRDRRLVARLFDQVLGSGTD
ncbi:MAG TPA: HlyD family efflux transporter periplasmic adaptor subunit [Longimicrobium sp.]|jgi:HlyD family secretion protein